MVVLVLGSSGQLGQAIQSIAGEYPTMDFQFCTSSDADVTDFESLKKVFQRISPDYCINAAAYTAVDKAESEPHQAYAINSQGAANVAQACTISNTILVHISTDFVFDGKKKTPYNELDIPNPIGVYGDSKYDGENQIRKILQAHIIIRTSWLYSEFGSNFLKTMLRLASERDIIQVVDDQTGTPTHAVDLAKAIVHIILSNVKAFGTFHYSNEGHTTWYGFAKEILLLHNKKVMLRPIGSADYKTAASRPSYSVLDKTKIRNAFGLDIDDWSLSLTLHHPHKK